MAEGGRLKGGRMKETEEGKTGIGRERGLEGVGSKKELEEVNGSSANFSGKVSPN